MQGLIDNKTTPVERLGESWHTPQGIQTGADAYTRRIQTRLERAFPEVKRRLDTDGAKTGEPVLELPAGWEHEKPWSDHPDALARSIEPDAILYAAVDVADYTSLVWLDRTDDPPQTLIHALERWKPLLEKRAEIVRNPKRRWWECAWPRDKEQLRKPKVIALYRTDRGRFALDEAGDWQPSIKTTLVIPKRDGLSVAYVCGLLNSESLDLWYAVRGKAPRDVWRNYEPKPMAEIPYRGVDDLPAAESPPLAKLDEAIARGDAKSAAGLCADFGADLRANKEDASTQAAGALERIVRAIAANRQAVLPFRPRFRALERTVKDPWDIGPATPDRSSFVAQLPADQTITVRIDPELHATVESDGVLGRPRLNDGALELVYKRQVMARVDGPAARLDLLVEILGAVRRILPDDLLRAELPKDLDAFEQSISRDSEIVAKPLADGRTLVGAAERLVCRLFDIPSDLEDEVVAHALQRATVRHGGGDVA